MECSVVTKGFSKINSTPRPSCQIASKLVGVAPERESSFIQLLPPTFLTYPTPPALYTKAPLAVSLAICSLAGVFLSSVLPARYMANGSVSQSTPAALSACANSVMPLPAQYSVRAVFFSPTTASNWSHMCRNVGHVYVLLPRQAFTACIRHESGRSCLSQYAILYVVLYAIAIINHSHRHVLNLCLFDGHGRDDDSVFF